MTDPSLEQKSLREYLRPVLSRWWLILLVVPVVTAGTYYYYDHKEKSYQASAQLFVQPSTLDQLLLGSDGSSEQSIENLALLIQTSSVGEEVSKRLEAEAARSDDPRPAEGALAGQINAVPVEKSNFIVITATAPSAVGAAKLANSYAGAFASSQASQLHAEARQTVAAARRQLAKLPAETAAERGSGAGRRIGLEEKIQTLELVAAQPASRTGIKQVEAAVPPSAPSDHDPKKNAVFAFFLGLMLAIGAAYGLEYLNRRITTIEGVEETFGLPILAELPKVGKPAPLVGSSVGMAPALQEPFHRLQTNLDLLAYEGGLRSILVVSAAPGEGKSIVTRNLALAFREAGRNVAVFDADLRRPSLGSLLAAAEGPGLTDVLAGRASIGETIQEVQVPINGGVNGHGMPATGSALTQTAPALRQGELAILPAGPQVEGLPATLGSSRFRSALSAAVNAYDTVLIDSSPLLATADVLPLLSEVDGVVIVTRLGKSTVESATRLLTAVRGAPNARLLGVVVNAIPSRLYRSRAYGSYHS